MTFLSGACMVLTLSLLAACATIVSGTTQEVTFQSSPDDVVVTLTALDTDDPTKIEKNVTHVLGNTPLTIEIDRGDDHTVTFSKAGYKPLQLELTTESNPWLAANIFIGGGFSSTTDLMSGAAYEYVKFVVDAMHAESIASAHCVATDATGARQPITTAIEVSRHPQGGVMVLFGTGRYLGVGDPLTTQTQTVYGVRDNGSAVADRDSLVQQSVIATQAAFGSTFRAVSSNGVNYALKSGWFLDLPDSGERVAVDPILRYKRLVVTTLVPSVAECSPGGTSWLMEIDYLNGAQPSTPPFDANRDGVVNADDAVNFAALLGGNRAPSGLKLDAISSSPAVVSGFGADGGLENKYLNQSTGAIRVVGEAGEPLASRRSSWREVSP